MSIVHLIYWLQDIVKDQRDSLSWIQTTHCVFQNILCLSYKGTAKTYYRLIIFRLRRISDIRCKIV